MVRARLWCWGSEWLRVQSSGLREWMLATEMGALLKMGKPLWV
jgi:hypothetical protein